MSAHPPAVLFARAHGEAPGILLGWLEGARIPVTSAGSADDLMALALRGRPRLAVFDDRDGERSFLALLRLKSDSYTGIVPAVMLTDGSSRSFEAAFRAGADEVLRRDLEPREFQRRLDLLIRRSDRDVYVHPSTRLPGTVAIEEEMQRRIDRGDRFAVCYADLDHFKEFNDRYSYYDGDRVIRLLSMLLHDVVKGVCGEQGFIGHIGGDDFIFVIPAEYVTETCGEIVTVFDTLIGYQYSEQDRRAGYFFGKDRRGQLHRVPLMTLSIGVVTNERRTFTTAASVSHLATEMKGYAKTLNGSVYSVDRRTDGVEVGEKTPPRAPRAISIVDE
ncbi:MAG: diguanylate cyclase [Gemmatimonadaceae bacterium]|nr:diguanylate cyclase [Gemmatimonadaceae bacterium]